MCKKEGEEGKEMMIWEGEHTAADLEIKVAKSSFTVYTFIEIV